MPTPHGEAPITWSKSKQLWRCTIDLGYRPDGTRHRVEVTSRNRNTLIDKRRKALRAIEDGTYLPGRTPTLTAWWDTWINRIAADRVRPRTLQNYRSYGRRHILPHIGRTRLDKITPQTIRFLHDRMRAAGTGDRTIQAVHNTLSACLKAATREGVIAHNPCDQLDAPRVRLNMREAFTPAEVRALLTTAAGDPPAMAARWLTALMIGARQGEALGLEWDRVNLDDRTVDLSWQLQRVPWAHGADCPAPGAHTPARCECRTPAIAAHMEWRPCHRGIVFTRPKTTASVRLTPLPGPLVDALEVWRGQAPDNPHGLVWAGGNGRPVEPREDRAGWADLCRRAGVRPLTLHSARHTMATLLLDQGVQPEVLTQIMGHSTVLSTRNYLHVSLDQARRALDTWGRITG